MAINGTEGNNKETKETKNEHPQEYKPLYISTKLIRPNRFNPRTDIDKESDSQLFQNIAIRGVETAIHIRPIEKDEEGHLYEIYDGDRRLRAAIKAKIAKVPVLILSKTDDEVLEFGITSTIRRDLGPVEIGRTCVKLLKRFSEKYPNQRAMANILGISTARINQYVKLVTDLDPEVQERVAPADQSQKIPEGAIDGRMGYEISKIEDKERQREVAQELISQPKLKGDRVRLLIAEAREEPETPVKELTSRRLQQMEQSRITLVMTSEDYERIIAGKQRIVVERHLRPGLSENTIVEPLLKAPEHLKISDVFKRPLGRFNESDAKNAGYRDLATFKEVWIAKQANPEKPEKEWDPQELVYVVLFKQPDKSTKQKKVNLD